MTPPSSWDVVALADMMISQDPGAFSCHQKAILDRSEVGARNGCPANASHTAVAASDWNFRRRNRSFMRCRLQ